MIFFVIGSLQETTGFGFISCLIRLFKRFYQFIKGKLKQGSRTKNKNQAPVMNKSDNVLSKDAVIVNALGLHARSAAQIAKLAQAGKSNVWIIKDKIKADASSIIDLLTLACGQGSKITVKIDHHSDLNVLRDLVKLIENGFGE